MDTSTSPDGTGLTGALHLAHMGYAVFPARTEIQTDGRVNKPPVRGVMWTRESTAEERTIREWWARWPDALVAIDCGKSGIVVLDVDPRHGGSWDEPGGYATLSGGRHVLYAEPRSPIGCDNTGRVAPGVDVKGAGGYVVCWRPLDVRDRPTALPPTPERVVAAMRRAAGTPPGQTVELGSDPVVSRPVPAFEEPARVFTREQAGAYVTQEALEPLRAAPEGGRNHQLNASAVVVGHFVPAFWPVQTVTETLAGIARTIGLDEREIGPTIASGLRRGMAEAYLMAEAVAERAENAATAGDAVAALLAEMLDTDGLDGIPDPEPLIEGFLVLDSLASIVGKSGKGKSFVSIDMACSVGTGLAWHGHDVAKGEVVYLVAEGARGIKHRVRAWEQHHGRKATGVRFLPRPIQAADPEWLTLIEACRRLDPVLIVIDTQARVTVGIEENSAKEMGEFIHRAEALRAATGACVALVHHTGHQGEEGRGSTAVKGALQTQLSVNKADALVTVSTLKQKDDEEARPVMLSLVPVLESAVLVGQGEPVRTEKGEDRFVPVPDPEDTFRGHVQDLVGIFLSVFSEGTGGTRAEVRAHFVALGHVASTKPDVQRRAFNRAWARLEEMGRLTRTEGTQRYKFVTIDELDRQRIESGHSDPGSMNIA